MVVETVVQIVRDVVAALVAVTGVVVAMVGLQTWRRQLRGSVELETARLVLRASYRMRDTISSVLLSSFMSERQWFAPLQKEDIGERFFQKYTEDWKAVMDSRSALRLAELEGEVLWGKSFMAAMEPLKKCVQDLSVAHDESLRSRETEASQETRPRKSLSWLLALRTERTDKQSSDSFSVLMPWQPFQRRVEAAIECLEDFVRPRMELRQ